MGQFEVFWPTARELGSFAGCLMNWTCEQTELLLTDYLDGLLSAAEQHEFDAHVNSCPRCTPLVSGVTHAISALQALPQIDPSPRLVYNILDKTLGQREDQLPNNQDSTTPQTSPAKNPGSTDGSAPASPKQQNRANDLASRSLVLAAACPVCSEGRIQ